VALAAERGFADVVREVLKHLPQRLRNLLVHNPVEFAAYDERRPLAIAALHGHEEVVLLLLNEGADISARDIHQISSLAYAMCSGEPKVIKHMLEWQQDDSQHNPLKTIAVRKDSDSGKIENSIIDELKMLLLSALQYDRPLLAQRILKTGKASLQSPFPSEYYQEATQIWLEFLPRHQEYVLKSRGDLNLGDLLGDPYKSLGDPGNLLGVACFYQHSSN